jgi:hypothetical protein
VTRAALAALLAAAGLSACAASAPAAGPTADAPPRQCFWARNVNGFNAVDRETVRVTVGVREVWELKLFGTCLDVDWATAIGIRGRGSDRICSGADAEIIVPSGVGRSPQRCLVQSVRRVSPEELEAEKAARR